MTRLRINILLYETVLFYVSIFCGRPLIFSHDSTAWSYHVVQTSTASFHDSHRDSLNLCSVMTHKPTGFPGRQTWKIHSPFLLITTYSLGAWNQTLAIYNIYWSIKKITCSSLTSTTMDLRSKTWLDKYIFLPPDHNNLIMEDISNYVHMYGLP